MALNLIQKVNALYQKIPFRFGYVLKGIYKGYQCEIVDLTSRGNYTVSVNFTRINLNPDQVLPTIEEKSKINKQLQDLKRKEYLDDPIAQEVLSVTEGNIEKLYELMYSNDRIGLNFLILIFEKIKKQFEETGITEIQEFESEEQVDYEATFEQLVNLNSNVAEYFDDPISHSLLNCVNLLQLTNTANFINSHSIEIQNREKNLLNYNRREHLHLLITAYLFIFLNQLNCQIDNNLLRSLGIRIRPNDNPETIIKVLEFFDFIKKNKDDQINNFILQLEKIDGIERIHPVNIKIRSDFIGNGPYPRKFKQPSYNVILPLPIKKAIEEPIRHYILEKIKNKIKKTKITEELKALKILEKNFLLSKRSSEFIKARIFYHKYFKEYYHELKQRQKIVENKVYYKKPIPTVIKNKIKEELIKKMKKTLKSTKEYKVLEHLANNFDDRYILTGNPDYYKIIEPYLIKYNQLLSEKIKKEKKIDTKLFQLLVKLKDDTMLFIRSSTKLTTLQKNYLLKNFDSIIRNGRSPLLSNLHEPFANIIYQIYMEYIKTRYRIINTYNKYTMKNL